MYTARNTRRSKTRPKALIIRVLRCVTGFRRKTHESSCNSLKSRVLRVVDNLFTARVCRFHAFWGPEGTRDPLWEPQPEATAPSGGRPPMALAGPGRPFDYQGWEKIRVDGSERLVGPLSNRNGNGLPLRSARASQQGLSPPYPLLTRSKAARCAQEPDRSSP